jgi:hypothetical protein
MYPRFVFKRLKTVKTSEQPFIAPSKIYFQNAPLPKIDRIDGEKKTFFSSKKPDFFGEIQRHKNPYLFPRFCNKVHKK